MNEHKQLTIADKYNNLINELENKKAEFMASLPNGLNYDKFVSVIKTAMISVPDMVNSDRQSFIVACLQCARDGLIPDGKESALVAFKGKVTYMPMIKGLIKKLHATNLINSISANIVYANDEFEYILGDDEKIIHKPNLNNHGEIIGVYIIIKTKTNGIYREFMTFNEIEKIRKLSNNKAGTFWNNHWGEMAKKSVMRRLLKLMPMDDYMVQVINNDDEFNSQDVIEQKKFIPIVEIVDITNISSELITTDNCDTLQPELEEPDYITELKHNFMLAINDERISDELEKYINNLLENNEITPINKKLSLTLIERLKGNNNV